jgi:hypothetical protein
MDKGNGELKRLCHLGSNAEGIAVRTSKRDDAKISYDVVVVYDNEKMTALKIEGGVISTGDNESPSAAD